MTQERWNRLSLFEQLSNIGGEVKRCLDSRDDYISHKSEKDYSRFYLNKARELVQITLNDPKNKGRGPELWDELYELEKYLELNGDRNYIMRYWDQYTEALSAGYGVSTSHHSSPAQV